MGRIEQKVFGLSHGELIIRNAEVKDAEELLSAVKKADEETVFMLREPGELDLTEGQEEKFIKDRLEEEYSVMILAEYDHKIIGSCGINGNALRRKRHCASLGIAVLKEYWGIGAGRKLMEEAVNWCSSMGIKRLELYVDTENFRAMNMYLKFGFIVEGTIYRDILMSDGKYRNSYIMARMF